MSHSKEFKCEHVERFVSIKSVVKQTPDHDDSNAPSDSRKILQCSGENIKGCLDGDGDCPYKKKVEQ